MSENAIDIAAIQSYAGEYKEDIFSTLVEKLTAMDDLTVIPDVKKALTFTQLSVGDGAEPYTGTFNPTGGDLDYKSRVLSVHDAKRELFIKPDSFRGTYLSKFTKKGFDPIDLPFEQFTWEQVMAKLAQELNSKTIYNGFLKTDAVAFDAGAAYAVDDYVTFTVGTKSHYYKCLAITVAGESPITAAAKWQRVNAEAICPGFGYHIAKAIADGDTTAVTTGALSNTNAVSKFELMAESVPTELLAGGVDIWCSYTDWNLYQSDYRERYGKYTQRNENGFYYIDGKEGLVRIRPAFWMNGTRRLIASVPENLLVGTDALSDLNEIETIREMYGLQASITFALGTQILDFGAIKVSDQV